MSNGGREYIKRRRLRLYREQKGKCYYCKCQMSLELEIPKHRKAPLDQCTIEHLFDRFDPRRGKVKGQACWVAACWKCNNERSQRRCREFIEQQRMKSGRLPTIKGVVVRPRADSEQTTPRAAEGREGV
jgi:hypothetical protein